MPAKANVVIGERYGTRVVVAEAAPIRGCTRVHVRCDCGRESVCYLTHFRSTIACRTCSATTHGVSAALTPEYQSWTAMHQRCSDANRAKASRYSGRGIFVDERWCGPMGFQNFLNDMGPRPNGTSLDRRNNDGPYSPENCRWATQREQCNNQSTNRRIAAFGKEMTLAEWSRETGIKRHTISWRLASGKPAEVALGRNL